MCKYTWTPAVYDWIWVRWTGSLYCLCLCMCVWCVFNTPVCTCMYNYWHVEVCASLCQMSSLTLYVYSCLLCAEVFLRTHAWGLELQRHGNWQHIPPFISLSPLISAIPSGAAFAKIRCSSRENGECVVGCNSRSHGLCPCFTMADKALYELKKNLLMTFWVVSFLASINLNVNLAWMQSTLLMLIILSYKLKIIKYYKISGERYKKKVFLHFICKKK